MSRTEKSYILTELILITFNLIIQKERKILPQKVTYLYVEVLIAATSCKNVETLPWKNDLSCRKSLLVTGLWDIILTSLLPPNQSCSSKFWVWSSISSNFDKGWRGDHKHKIMDGLFMPKYGTVSQVLLQLVVASIRRSYKRRFAKTDFRVTMLWQCCDNSKNCYKTQNRGCESPRAVSPLVCDPFIPLSLYVTCGKGGIIHVF